MAVVARTAKQIDDVLSKIDVSESKYPGMTYEQGVQEALQWVLGEIDDAPLSE